MCVMVAHGKEIGIKQYVNQCAKAINDSASSNCNHTILLPPYGWLLVVVHSDHRGMRSFLNFWHWLPKFNKYMLHHVAGLVDSIIYDSCCVLFLLLELMFSDWLYHFILGQLTLVSECLKQSKQHMIVFPSWPVAPIMARSLGAGFVMPILCVHIQNLLVAIGVP